MKKWEFTILFALLLSILLTSFSSFSEVCAAVRDDTLRLHILANSNSEIDQSAKLYVRDKILEMHAEIFGLSSNKASAVQSAQSAAELVKNTAQNALSDKGLNYDVTVSVVNMYFATTPYDGFTLPAGRYDALRVELGKAVGKNWFCVLFPPLCVPASMDDAANGYTSAEQSVVKNPYKVKFAIVEWFAAAKESLRIKFDK